QVIKLVDIGECEILAQGFDQHQQFLDRNRNAGVFQAIKKIDQHVGRNSATRLAAVYKGKTLEQVHVLLVFQQGPVQRRNDLGVVAILQYLFRNIVGEQQFQPVDQLRAGRLFLQTGDVPQFEKYFERLLYQCLLDTWIVHFTDLTHGVAVGKTDEVEEAATQECIG